MSWQIKKLGELCTIKTGKKDVNQGNPDGKYPFFTCAKDHTYSDEYSFNAEALLIAGNGDVGNVSYYKGKFEAYQRTYVLSGFRNVLSRYLFIYLDGYLKGTVSKQKLGNTMPYIKMGMLTSYDVPIPPLPVQRRIVKKLDKIFADIEKAKRNTKKNLQNASEIFESYLLSVFSNPGKGWEEKRLGEIATFRNGMNFTKGSKGESIKIVGVKDFQNNFWAPLEHLESVTIDGKLSDTDRLKAGDILAVRSNGNPKLIGRTVLTGNVAGKVSHSGFTIRIRTNPNQINPIYLCQYLKLSRTRNKLIESGTGINIKSLNQVALSSVQIIFPKSLKEQVSIAAKLDALSTKTKKLEAIYKQKLADLDELKKSVLKKTFAGEL